MLDHNSSEMKRCRCQSCNILQLVICVNSYYEAAPACLLWPHVTRLTFLSQKNIILRGCAIIQPTFDHLFAFNLLVAVLTPGWKPVGHL